MSVVQKLVCVVTGANRGLGFSLVNLLSRAGHRTVLACRTMESGLEAIEKMAIDHSIERSLLAAVPLDLSNLDSVPHAVSMLRELHPEGYNVVVNNAGVNIIDEPEKVIGVNFTGTSLFASLMKPLFRKRGGGEQEEDQEVSVVRKMINVSSRLVLVLGDQWEEGVLASFLNVSRREELLRLCSEYCEAFAVYRQGGEESALSRYGGYSKFAPYVVSKAALTGFTGLCHREWGESDGIVVTCCSPGWCQTDMGRLYAKHAPGDPYWTPDEGVQVILWLIEHSTVSGHGGRFWYANDAKGESIEEFVKLSD